MAKNKKKSSGDKAKAKKRKLSVKKEPIKDLDLSELDTKQVKGGTAFRSAPRRI
jgi:hypothetical protein